MNWASPVRHWARCSGSSAIGDRLRLPDDPAEIPTRVPLTSLLLGGAPYPRQANGEYEVRVGEETVRVAVDAGQIHAAPESEPDTTIELSRPGMRALILGARASEIEETGDLSVRGNRRRAHALLNTLTGPPRLAGLRPQLEAAAGDAQRGDQRRTSGWGLRRRKDVCDRSHFT
jgi:hypothetical protein